MTRWRRRVHAGPDDGMSLAELSVSIVVLGILMTATLLVTVQVQRLYMRDTASEDSLQAARYAMDVVAKDVRAVVKNRIGGIDLAFSQTTGTAVTFYLPDSVSGLLKEEVFLDGAGRLWRRTTQADASSTDPAYTYTTNRGQRTTLLASGVAASTGGTPLFAYVVNGAVSTSVTTDTDRVVISAVVITLTDSARSDQNAAPPVTLVNTVNPLNI